MDWERQHKIDLARLGQRIEAIYEAAAKEAAAIGVTIDPSSIFALTDELFTFDRFPITHERIDKLMASLHDRLQVAIVDGIDSQWSLANQKNNELCRMVFADSLPGLSLEQQRRYFGNNEAAREAFKLRQQDGLGLSDRVWHYTDLYKHEMEMALDVGIRSGQSAHEMARDLKHYLQYPDKLFRRVRDLHGNLVLSQAARAFHPGQGVYRSSFMNARRLAVTENNIAYRTADFLRIQQLDFVVGIEVHTSGNHTSRGHKGVFMDICDELQGRYPKDFKFTGWHPHCRCYTTTILKTAEEFQTDQQRIQQGQAPAGASVNAVTDVPDGFKRWMQDNEERIGRASQRGTLPYFLRDNGTATADGFRLNDFAKGLSSTAGTPLPSASSLQLSLFDLDTPDAITPRIPTPPEPEHEPPKPTPLEIAARRHASRTPEDIARLEALRDAWLERNKQRRIEINRAKSLLAAARNHWPLEIDTSELTRLIHSTKDGLIVKGDTLEKIKWYREAIARNIKSLREDEKALSDIIPDVHKWHQQFTIDELQQVKDEVNWRLSNWKGLSYQDLDYELQMTMDSLQAKKATATWEVLYAAYEKQVIAVQAKMWKLMDNDIAALHAFKTKSSAYKKLLADIDAARATGDADLVRDLIQEAQDKMANLLSPFGPDAYSQKRKNAALWAKSTAEADKELRADAGKQWIAASDREKDAIFEYTYTYNNIQEPLRGIQYIGTPDKIKRGKENIKHITNLLERCKSNLDVWFQRGDKIINSTKNPLKKFGIGYPPSDAEIYALVGKEAIEPAFWSMGVAKGTGFANSDIIWNIYIPKKGKYMYIEPISQYGNGAGRTWDGISKQTTFGNESEALLQRGSKMRVTKVEKKNGKWFIDVDIIEQTPVAFPYKNGVPHV